MSLYYEAVQILNTTKQNGGSIKSTTFGKKDWKSNAKALFALATETARWSAVLSEIIERSGILKFEKQLTPELALVLTHDLLLAKKGLALPPQHGLAVAISRHKARLNAELTKVRIKRGCSTIDALKAEINNQSNGFDSRGDASSAYRHPRWVRINTILTSLDEQLQSTFATYKSTDNVTKVMQASQDENLLYVDDHIPGLIAIPHHIDITSTSAYKKGQIILQDKASCFPAVLLDPGSLQGDVTDACAAPGNKTTHLAALLSQSARGSPPATKKRKVFACERDAQRSVTLNKMVKLAGADEIVEVKTRQDFLKLEPQAREFANVTAILLDPSCSGSGIVGRDEATLELHLPSVDAANEQKTNGKKRKRNDTKNEVKSPALAINSEQDQEEVPEDIPNDDKEKLKSRLTALSSFQLRLLEHAMTFPAVSRITYSTCSLHDEENELVVAKALMSDVAARRGWRVLRRVEQVRGMREWHKRGTAQSMRDLVSSFPNSDKNINVEEVAESCIRCDKGSADGTIGFFVAAFTRDIDGVDETRVQNGVAVDGTGSDFESVEKGEEDEWEGFSDEG